jgi:hypothetical protein
MSGGPAFDREAQRQQQLLRALWREGDAADDVLAWLRGAPARQRRGLQAYRVNAAVSAERALAAAYPSVAALIGTESFAALARDFWRQQPPERGDLGQWGAALPAFIADSQALASEPYLADSARLDWLVHVASRAADAPDAPPALDALATQAPDALAVRLRPGTAVLASDWPVASIWLAHQPASTDGVDDGERFAAARDALAAGRAECALVWRDGHEVLVEAIDRAGAAFAAALLGGASLAAALDAAGDGFAFDQWFVHALRQRLIVALHPMETE